MSGFQGSTSLTPVDPGIIAFIEIPYTYKVPGVYYEVKAAVNAQAVLPFPAYGLIMGQQFLSGQATPFVIYTITSAQQANALFGTGSIAAEMCWAWLKVNPYTPLDCMGISDATGAVAATGSAVFGGPATGSGTIPFYFGGVRVPVPVNAGDTAVIMCQSLIAAITAQNGPGFEPMPGLIAAYAGGTAHNVSFTAANAGTLGNQIDIRVCAQTGEMLPPGVTVTINQMSGGATDPTTYIAAELAAISKWYTDVAFSWTDTTNTATFSAWLNGRYGALTKLDCHGYVATDATYGNALNYNVQCKYLSVIPMQNPLTPSWKLAAATAAACCLSTAQQPALQMKGVYLPGIVAPAAGDVFTAAEREQLLVQGFSTYDVDCSGNVYLERVTTSYRVDPSGAQNTNWFDLQDAKVPTRVRYDWENYIGQLYPRNLLCNDGSLAAAYAPNVVTPAMLKASWTSRSGIYEQNGWIKNSAVTAAQSSFAIDPNDGNRVNARQQIQVMGNLIVLAGSLEFISNN